MGNALARSFDTGQSVSVGTAEDSNRSSDSLAILDDFEVLLEAAERITKSSRPPDQKTEPAAATSCK